MEYSMRWVREHVEVYDHTGRFLFSADSESEARRELEEDFHAAACPQKGRGTAKAALLFYPSHRAVKHHALQKIDSKKERDPARKPSHKPSSCSKMDIPAHPPCSGPPDSDG